MQEPTANRHLAGSPPRSGNPSANRAREPWRAPYIAGLQAMTATAFVYLAQDYGWRSTSGKESTASTTPGLPGMMACDPEIVRQCILATLQTMHATHGTRVHALAAMVMRDEKQLAPGTSPSFFLAAADLTWSRLAGPSGILDADRVAGFSRLSQALDGDMVHERFAQLVSEAALRLCSDVDPDMPRQPSRRDVPTMNRFAATSVNQIVAQARQGLEHIADAPEVAFP